MSHITPINMVIMDLNALKAACREWNLPFMENQRTNEFYGGKNKCLHAIKVPNARYEIGVVQNPNGKGYILAFDSYGTTGGQPIVKLLGKGLEKLRQSYSLCKGEIECRKRAWTTQRVAMPNGSVKLKMSGM